MPSSGPVSVSVRPGPAGVEHWRGDAAAASDHADRLARALDLPPGRPVLRGRGRDPARRRAAVPLPHTTRAADRSVRLPRQRRRRAAGPLGLGLVPDDRQIRLRGTSAGGWRSSRCTRADPRRRLRHALGPGCRRADLAGRASRSRWCCCTGWCCSTSARTIAETTVMLIAFCPVAFFFSAVYTESLFLALSVGCDLRRAPRALAAGGPARRPCGGVAQRRRRADPAGGDHLPLRPAHHGRLPGVRAGRARRSSGLRLLLPRYRLRLDAVWMLLIPAGLGAYLAYLGIKYGQALAPFHAEAVWYRHSTLPLDDGLAGGQAGLGRPAPAGPRSGAAIPRARLRPECHQRRAAGRLPVPVPGARRGRADPRPAAPAVSRTRSTRWRCWCWRWSTRSACSRSRRCRATSW